MFHRECFWRRDLLHPCIPGQQDRLRRGGEAVTERKGRHVYDERQGAICALSVVCKAQTCRWQYRRDAWYTLWKVRTAECPNLGVNQEC